MDVLWNILDSVQNLFVFSDEDTTSTESTFAPKYYSPIDFDITAKPINTGPIVEIVPSPTAEASGEIKDLIDQVLNTFESTPGDWQKADTAATSKISIKIIEKITGKTIEVVNNITTISNDKQPVSTTINTINYSTEDLHDSQSTSTVLDNLVVQTATSYVNVSVIAALTVLILMLISIGITIWCRKNKLKAVKRNAGKYPVITEYMNNPVLNNTEKIKNIP